MVTNLIGFGARGSAATPSFYDDIVGLGLDGDLEACFDFGSADCYSGSGQVVYDLTANDVDFHVGTTSGVTTTDPAFNGTAGDLSSAEFFLFNGDDVLQAQSQPAFIQAYHKDNATLTMCMVMRKGGASTTDIGAGTIGGGSGGIGFQWLAANADETMCWQVKKSGGTNVMAQCSSDTVSVSPNDIFVGVAVNEADGSGGLSFQMVEDTEEAFDSTYTSPDTGSALETLNIGGNGGGDGPVGADTRIYGIAFWSAALTASNVDSIREKWLVRFA